MGKSGKTGKIPGKTSLKACGLGCGGLMPSNSGLVAVEMLNLMAGGQISRQLVDNGYFFFA
jgi:hypothetical protein